MHLIFEDLVVHVLHPVDCKPLYSNRIIMAKLSLIHTVYPTYMPSHLRWVISIAQTDF